jgi:hydroxymethylpyrimidine pyrophosphatase-like HAD family hydrolase
MVTGREIEDLKGTFSRFDLFEVIVAENGGVLYYPAANEHKLLHEPPPARFVTELCARGIVPLSVGKIILASREPNQTIFLEVIKHLGLELEIIFNKGSVMVLPTGVNKATGLKAALREYGCLPERTVGIGDAENDHAFLKLCGCSAAVSNALPSVKETADLVTRGARGAGVTELADLLIQTDLEGVVRRAPARLPLDEDPRVLSGVGAQPGKTP